MSNWYTDPQLKALRIRRLYDRGVDAFPDFPQAKDEDLQYAEFEFQVYSKASRTLARRNVNGELEAANTGVCDDLQQLADGQALGSEWNQQWEYCLRRWEGFQDPANGSPTPDEDPYLCPVEIVRTANLNPGEGAPTEHTESGVLDRRNVWSVGEADEARYFFARDCSGMFVIHEDDPALDSPGYEPPEDHIASVAWLSAKPRSFAQVQIYRQKGLPSRWGVVVQPWRYCELLPCMVSDRDLIESSVQWRNIFRTVRAVSEVESSGYFDRLQGYDKGNMSLPLFQYTAPSAGSAVELGGLLAWLQEYDRDLWHRFAQMGLTHRKGNWADADVWGTQFECHSGALLDTTGVMRSHIGLNPSAPSAEQEKYLRRPHFQYRVAMLCRTELTLRDAMWRLAVHRLRNLAWTEVDSLTEGGGSLPPALVARKYLGKILTSELSLALALRIHVKTPANIKLRVRDVIANAWNASVLANGGRPEVEVQAAFELNFCQTILETTPEVTPASADSTLAWLKGSSIRKVAIWPVRKFHPFAMRLTADQLDPTATSTDKISRLSWLAYTSPFFTNGAFVDPVDAVEWGSGPSDRRHPLSSTRDRALSRRKAFADLGVGFRFPAGFALPEATYELEHGSREALAALASPYLLKNGRVELNPRPLTLRPHIGRMQRWSRKQIARMQRDGFASALRCSKGHDVPPPPAEALWQLDIAVLTEGQEVHVFDWREGERASEPLAKIDKAASAIRSLENSANCSIADPQNFGIGASQLELQTFDVFRLTMQSLGLLHVDSFVVHMKSGVALTVASLHQPFGSGLKEMSSNWGFYVEYLAWRYGRYDETLQGWHDGPFGRHLLPLGIDAWLRRTHADGAGFLSEPWPTVAVALGATQSTPIEPGLRVAPARWDPRPNRAKYLPADLAATLLTWPNLYRLRKMIREEPDARRALFDVWRMGLRSALRTTSKTLQKAFGQNVALWNLLQTPASLSALALWRQEDPESLRKYLGGQHTKLATALAQWILTNGDFKAWPTTAVEHEFFWDVVLPSLPASLKIRARLATLKPNEPPTQRTYIPALDQLVDLNGLDDVPAPAGNTAEYTPVLLGPGNDVQLGLLIAEAAAATVPEAVALDAANVLLAPPAAAATRTEYWVSGIVPVLTQGGGVPLMLAQPVKVSLGEKPGTQKDVDIRWSKDDQAQTTTFDVVSLDGEFLLEADVSSWLGDLSNAARLILRAEALENAGTWDIALELVLSFRQWLLAPLRIRTSIGQIRNLARVGTTLVWRVPMAAIDASAFPISLNATGDFVLTVGLDNALKPLVRFAIEISGLTINLGSPVAVLALNAVNPGTLSIEADLMTGEVSAVLPDSIAARLSLMLAARELQSMRLVPTRGGSRGAPTSTPFLGIDLGEYDVTSLSAPLRRIDLSTPLLPAIPAAILARPGRSVSYENRTSSLLDIAQEWMSGLSQDVGLTPVGDLKVEISQDGTLLEVTGRIELAIGTAGKGSADLCIDCAIDNGMLDLANTGFALRSAVLGFPIAIDDSQRSFTLGPAARLLLPATLTASLDLLGNADRDMLTLAPGAGIDQPAMQFSIPAEGGFLFDIRSLSVGRGGLSLEADVHAGSLQLGELPTLAPDLTVERAADGIGKLVITRGRLTNASLKARARLRLFDDADGLLTVRIFNEGDGIGVLAELDAGVGRTFHLRALYLQVVVDSIRLRLGWSSGRWTASGGITGSARFVPEGPLVNRLAEYAELLDGTNVHFENLDLSNLGKVKVRVDVTPRTFDVAKIFSVTWRGFELGEIARIGDLSNLRLLGDIAFKAKLPNLRTELTLGDIQIRQVSRFSLVPEIRVSSIGIKVALDGGFSFRGRIVEYDSDREYGFGGEVSLESSLIAGIDVLVKLTRVYDTGKQNPEPSIVVYGETQREDHLGYGVFLRRLGIAVAVRQGLRGFSDGKDLTIAGRVDNALKNPIGLPYPGSLEGWVARHSSDPGPENLLVGYGLVSFGLLPMDKDHPFVGSLVVAIDDSLDIVAGINGWFFASPNNAKEDEFLRRPALRGALGLSPREQILYGRFMTLKNSKFGASIGDNKVAELLASALAAAVLPAAVYADSRGAILEVAHPRQARFDMQLGPARGMAEAGFRVGYYRGTAVVGLNLAVSAWIGGSFSGDLGFANVELKASASFQLQASFAGAITTSGKMYVLTELALTAALEISAHIWKIIRVSGWGFSFSVTLFDISASVGLTATALLDTAIVPDGIGFNGTVQVSIHIAGFGISARVRIGASEGRIDEARRMIAQLVPPIDELVKQRVTAQRASAALAAPPAATAMLVAVAPAMLDVADSKASGAHATDILVAPFGNARRSVAAPQRWRYFTVRVGDQLRVVLFPDGEESGGGYPRQSFDEASRTYTPRKHLLWLSKDAKSRFIGVVGRKKLPDWSQPTWGGDLELTEQADAVQLEQKWIVDHQGTAGRDLLVGDMLAGLVSNPDAKALEEIVDPRTIHPVSGDFDDPAVLVLKGRRSTRFRRRHSQDGELTYDDHLAHAAAQGTSTAAPLTSDDSTSSPGEVLAQLLNLARDPSVGADEDLPPLNIGGDTANPHFFASRLGLVLAFNDPPESGKVGKLEEKLRSGIEALLALQDHPDDAMKMFGGVLAAPAEHCLPAIDPKESVQIVPGFDFQGAGEVGLTWSVVRTRRNGESIVDGPTNHAGIGSFRVERRHAMARGIEEVPPARLRPAWIRYSKDAQQYAIRPQFQHVDSRLPLQGAGELEYTIEALAADDQTVIARTTMRVGYRPFVRTLTVANAQVLLRVPAADPKNPSSLHVEFLVAVSADGTADIAQVFGDVPARLQLYRRRAVPPQLGLYGDGTDVELSMSWEDAFSPGAAVALQLPRPDQSRQASMEDFTDEDRVQGLRWASIKEPGDSSTRLFATTIEMDAKTADVAWNRLLGQGELAAEFFVRIEGTASSADLPTPLLRARIALACKSRLAGTRSFTEGTEVAALERIPVEAGVERDPEWADPQTMQFRGEFWTEDDAPIVRLRGAVPLPQPTRHPFGAVVGMRLWCVETMGDVVMTRAEPWSDVLIHSLPMFRSLPRSVTVRTPGKRAPAAPDWRIEGPWLAVPANAVAGQSPEFAAVALAAGNKTLLHRPLADWIASVGAKDSSRRACVHLDEPMATAPPVEGANRLLEVLARNERTADWFGWRLLESIGGSATVWIESDDDRLDPEDWKDSGAREDVAVVTFSRLAPSQRPGDKKHLQWGVRVLSMPMLRELSDLSNNVRTVPQAADQGHLGAALAMLQRDSVDDKAAARYVQELLERARQFVDFNPSNGKEHGNLELWQSAEGTTGKTDETQKSAHKDAVAVDDPPPARPQVLPLIDGHVNFFHPLKPDYAKSLRVGVEIVRRYDLLAPSRPREIDEARAQVVDIPRTLDLVKEEWAVQVDGTSGAFTGVVAVHPAQRTSLYRFDLWRHVQFIGQRVDLQRRTTERYRQGWQSIFDRALDTLDEQAVAFNTQTHEASWLVDPPRTAQGLQDWPLDTARKRRIDRGFDRYEYRHLPPGYGYSITVRSQAGIRLSEPGKKAAAGAASAGDAGPQNDGLEPMFTRGHDLKYASPALRAWMRDDGILVWTLPLLRGIDALDERVRAHWTARDETWIGLDDGAGEVPVLQLPDPFAVYVLAAVARGLGDRQKITKKIELLHVRITPETASTRPRLLVPPYTEVDVSITQLSENDDAGRLGLGGEIALSVAELAWLRAGLADTSSVWSLILEVERDGQRYPATQQGDRS